MFEELKLLNCEEIKLDVSENNIVQVDSYSADNSSIEIEYDNC